MQKEDITPTWSAILPIHIACIQSNTSDGASGSIIELKRLAKYADQSIAYNKERKKCLFLYITDKGDQSVGINPQYWEIECPISIDKSNVDEKGDVKISPDDLEMLEEFKADIIKMYSTYCEGGIMAEYDFESEAEARREKESDQN